MRLFIDGFAWFGIFQAYFFRFFQKIQSFLFKIIYRIP